MIVSRDREKLINAIIYFLGATKHAHTLKLFKLLNFLDFEHFRQTGRTVTGLDYRALKKGPVPTKLLDEIKKGGGEDLRNSITLYEVKDEISDALLRRDLKPKADFQSKWFSRRELKIMERIAEFFRDLRAEDMSEFSHANQMPWKTVWRDGKGNYELIPPDLILKAAPLVIEEPTISDAELEDRRDLLRNSA